MTQAVSHRPLTAEDWVRAGQFVWNLWWTKWHLYRFFSEFREFSAVLAYIIPYFCVAFMFDADSGFKA
jgi:hypothetical protein